MVVPRDPREDGASDAGRVRIREIETRADKRGEVLEPVSGDELRKFQNCHVVVSRPGAVRGNHYHRVRHETMIVQGPALVRLRDAAGSRDVEVPSRAAYRIDVPAGIPHAVKNTGDEPGLVVVFATRSFDREDPDVYEEVLIE